MEVQEHFYTDDPRRGPADSWTTLPGVAYFFLGNGLIQAAVQVCAGPRGTPLGLLIMDPGRFRTKARSLSFDPDLGLQPTRVEVRLDGHIRAARPGQVSARWVRRDGVPAVEAAWRAPGLAVREEFFCPELRRPRLVRKVTVKNTRGQSVRARVSTGIPGQTGSAEVRLAARRAKSLYIEYHLTGGAGGGRCRLAWGTSPKTAPKAQRQWQMASRFESGSPLLDRLCLASLFQLPASVAASGRLDGSIWQYNREWARDQAMVAIGLVLGGQFETARVVLNRVLSTFVTPEGDTIDSSERRPPAECELDQNGAVLFALERYVLWTGDLLLPKRHWRKIRAAADFPLRRVFRHAPSGLLHNRREFWERHAAHGIEDGIELAHQHWVSQGLSSAARLARALKKRGLAARWEQEAERLKEALLADTAFCLVHRGAFIKRRMLDGRVEFEVFPRRSSGLPVEAPLFGSGRHLLNPDTSTVLPIAWEFIPAGSKLASRTLETIEELWNQDWRGGGYGRYHLSSEPDSPGPWPFPSLFVARACFESGLDARVWRVLRWLGRAPGSAAGSWFEFYGPRPVPPYPQVGIVPWTWAEMITLFIHHLAGCRPEWHGLRLRPRLLEGLAGYRASLRVRNARIDLAVEPARPATKAGYIIDGKFYPYFEEGILIPYPRSMLSIRARIPAPARKS
jgi:hypothetical protein